MRRHIGIIILLIISIQFSSCSANKYISHNSISFDFEGEWYFKNNPIRKLTISKIEDNIYNVKFNSESNNWEGIGYNIEEKLLTIFKYQKLNKYGYITFNFIEKNKIYFKSINPDGEFRSEGYFNKFKTP